MEVIHSNAELTIAWSLQWTISSAIAGTVSTADIDECAHKAAVLGNSTSKCDWVSNFAGTVVAFDYDGGFEHSRDGAHRKDLRKCQQIVQNHEMHFVKIRMPNCPKLEFHHPRIHILNSEIDENKVMQERHCIGLLVEIAQLLHYKLDILDHTALDFIRSKMVVYTGNKKRKVDPQILGLEGAHERVMALLDPKFRANVHDLDRYLCDVPQVIQKKLKATTGYTRQLRLGGLAESLARFQAAINVTKNEAVDIASRVGVLSHIDEESFIAGVRALRCASGGCTKLKSLLRGCQCNLLTKDFVATLGNLQKYIDFGPDKVKWVFLASGSNIVAMQDEAFMERLLPKYAEFIGIGDGTLPVPGEIVKVLKSGVVHILRTKRDTFLADLEKYVTVSKEAARKAFSNDSFAPCFGKDPRMAVNMFSFLEPEVSAEELARNAGGSFYCAINSKLTCADQVSAKKGIELLCEYFDCVDKKTLLMKILKNDSISSNLTDMMMFIDNLEKYRVANKVNKNELVQICHNIMTINYVAKGDFDSVEAFRREAGLSEAAVKRFKGYTLVFKDHMKSAEDMKYVCAGAGFVLSIDYSIFLGNSSISRTLNNRERYVEETNSLCKAVCATTKPDRKKIYCYCAQDIFDVTAVQALKDLHGLGINVPTIVAGHVLTSIKKFGPRLVDRAREILGVIVDSKSFTKKQVGAMLTQKNPLHRVLMKDGCVPVLKDELRAKAPRQVVRLVNLAALVQKVNDWQAA
jgi:hypothetical protein